jgi:hypothetical protein
LWWTQRWTTQQHATQVRVSAESAQPT